MGYERARPRRHRSSIRRATRSPPARGDAALPARRAGTTPKSSSPLNIHFHMLVLDGAYLVGTEPPRSTRGAHRLLAGRERFNIPRQGTILGEVRGQHLAAPPSVGLRRGSRCHGVESEARYATRPAVVVERLTLTPQGQVHMRDHLCRHFVSMLSCVIIVSAWPVPRAGSTRFHCGGA